MDRSFYQRAAKGAEERVHLRGCILFGEVYTLFPQSFHVAIPPAPSLLLNLLLLPPESNALTMNPTDGGPENEALLRQLRLEGILDAQSMFISQASSWSFSSAPDRDAEMGGQDPRAAGLGPAQASHEQRRPTSSEDTNPLRQHDEGPLQTEDRLGKSSSAFFGPHLTCMYCATPRRGLLGEKQARR
jgi:hypothetical protein